VAGRSRSMIAALIAVTVGAGLPFACSGAMTHESCPCYLGTWLAFLLYSLPPFRFKGRGTAGVLCDAAGEQLFPALVAVFIACRGAQRPGSGLWVASVAGWALAYGLRGIVGIS